MPEQERDDGTRDEQLAEDVSNALTEVEQEEDSADLSVLLRSPQGRQAVQQLVMTAVSVSEERHSGPLPSPRQLREYEEIVPGGAERIFQMAERQQSHRHQQEKDIAGLRVRVFEHVERREIRGQLIATGMSVFIGIIGGWLINLGHPNLGSALIVGTMASIAGVFITSRADKKKIEPPSED